MSFVISPDLIIKLVLIKKCNEFTFNIFIIINNYNKSIHKWIYIDILALKI
jgi:hypothetical protein